MISTEPICYRDDDTVLDGLLVRPDDPAPGRPGIVLVHGGAGLDDHARGQARRYAALGHPVLAADMYGRGVPGDRDRVMATIGWLRAAPGRVARRAGVGLAWCGAFWGNGSGDLAIAFTTANRVPHAPTADLLMQRVIAEGRIDTVFRAAAEATQEAVLDALAGATPAVGRDGRLRPALRDAL